MVTGFGSPNKSIKFYSIRSASGNLQSFLDYLFTLDAAPTEDEEHKIAHQFGLEPAYVKRLISRMRFNES